MLQSSSPRLIVQLAMNNNTSIDPGLRTAIADTVTFFDLANFPLTAFEIYKWLWSPEKKYLLGDVDTALRGMTQEGTLVAVDGWYCLPGRQQIIETRLERYQLAERKYRIALRAVRRLRWVPFVQMVAVCNTLGYSNAGVGSDIDFFIVGRRGRLWMVRLMVTTMVNLMGKRRHGRRIADHICLSFYVADDRLDLSTIALVPIDPYLVYWHATLLPLYIRNNAYEAFQHENEWIKAYVPNVSFVTAARRRTVSDYPVVIAVRSVVEAILSTMLGDALEHTARWLQVAKVRYHPAPAAHGTRSVVMNDSMLKFHEVDRRAMFRDEWHRRRQKFETI